LDNRACERSFLRHETRPYQITSGVLTMRTSSAPNFSSNLLSHSGHKASGSEGIKISIDEVSGPETAEANDAKNPTKDETKSQTVDEETGKTAAGGQNNQDTTVAPESANKKAVSINIGKILQDVKTAEQQAQKPEQAWMQTGAETDTNKLPRLLESIPGYPEIPPSDRGQILNNFAELQKQFDIREPSNLIGNPADPRDAANQMAQLGGQALLGPASGAFNHLDRSLGGGLGNNYNQGIQIGQLNQQVGNVGSITQVETRSPEVTITEDLAKPTDNPSDVMTLDGDLKPPA